MNTGEENKEAATEAAVDSQKPNTEEIVDKKEEISPRDRFRNRFKETHPDLDPNDEDAFYDAADKHLSELTDYKTKNTAINKTLLDVFNSNPELAEVVKDMTKGASFAEAIARNVDIDELKPAEGDPDEEKWKKALEERMAKKKAAEDYQKSIDVNSELSKKDFKEFVKENNLNAEQGAKIISKIDELVSDAIKGRITKNTLSSFYRAMNADNEVAQAAKVAEIKGRNANIEAKKTATKPKGDGLPKISSTTVEKEPKPKEKLDPFSEAIKYQLNKKRI